MEALRQKRKFRKIRFSEDENRIENQIGHCSRHCGNHSKSRASVRTDDRVHGLAEHIKRNAKGNIEKVFLRIIEGFLVDTAAEHGQNRVHENKVDHSKNNTDQNTEQDRISDTLMGLLFFIPPEAEAHKGTAAVSDQHRQRQCHHGSSAAAGAFSAQKNARHTTDWIYASCMPHVLWIL